MQNKRGFLILIEIMIVVVIILFFYNIMINIRFGASNIDKDTRNTFKEQGIDTSNYKSILDSAKEKIKNIDQKESGRLKEAEDSLR